MKVNPYTDEFEALVATVAMKLSRNATERDARAELERLHAELKEQALATASIRALSKAQARYGAAERDAAAQRRRQARFEEHLRKVGKAHRKAYGRSVARALSPDASYDVYEVGRGEAIVVPPGEKPRDAVGKLVGTGVRAERLVPEITNRLGLLIIAASAEQIADVAAEKAKAAKGERARDAARREKEARRAAADKDREQYGIDLGGEA